MNKIIGSVFLMLLVCSSVHRRAAGTTYPSSCTVAPPISSAGGGPDDSLIAACISQAEHALNLSPQNLFTIVLPSPVGTAPYPTVYNLTKGLTVPSYTTLISSAGQLITTTSTAVDIENARDSVVLNRAWKVANADLDGPSPGCANATTNWQCLYQGASTGPLVKLTGTNITLAYVDINGQDHPPYCGALVNNACGYTNNVNVLVDGCTSCTVLWINSEHSRVASIQIQNSSSVTVNDSYIHNNGEPIDAVPDPNKDPFHETFRSDGLTVGPTTGKSVINHNFFFNNTDMNLILGGGMRYLDQSATMSVTNNTVAPDTLTRVPCPSPQTSPSTPCSGNNPLTGAGIMFDTENNWFGCTECGDFTGFTVTGNINQCGPNCNYGIAVGTNFSYPGFPVTGLYLDWTNQTDRITIDYTWPSSLINPTMIANTSTTQGCWVNVAESSAGSYNGGTCRACTGRPNGTCSDGTDFHDHGYGPLLQATPSTGTGHSAIFTLEYMDPNPNANLPWGDILINNAVTVPNACYIHYDRTANASWLRNVWDNGWIGPLFGNTNGILDNTLCAVSSLAAPAGSQHDFSIGLTVNFRSPFLGTKNIFMRTQDTQRAAWEQVGWEQVGSWTVQ